MNIQDRKPTYSEYQDSTLKVLMRYPGGAHIRIIEREVAADLKLSSHQLSLRHYNDPRSDFQYRLAWARTRLKQDGLVKIVSRGIWALTEAGLRSLDLSNSVQHGIFDEFEVPAVAAPLPGMDWTAEVVTGLLTPAPPVTSLSSREENELRSLLPPLVDAARDLVGMLQGARSNSAQRIAPVAERYFAAVSQPPETFSIDGMFAAGVRLRNAQHRLALEVAEEGFPDLSAEIGEAFDSTLGLHGPCLLGTTRGNELVRRAREDVRSRSDEIEFKAQAEEFAAKLRVARNLVTPAGKELMEQVSAEVGSGPQPERSTAVAEATTQTLLVKMAKVTIAEITKESFKSSVIGGASVAFGSALFNASTQFFTGNADQLKLLAAATGESLSWLPHFLNWVKLKLSAR
ncbi:winged helix-turn-helix domain-containing protein [Bosea sp. CS1GBMeth4]|uniref:winged helix-turn-helix domain-containing protein n=1 Tax=Bosea sp. CS1GBMeth4 TaxID=1892849 RepID=UPI00164458FB|nr:winged helix-turn-helix domain-containing protein [Bosea sp. CS1GBMeth4]